MFVNTEIFLTRIVRFINDCSGQSNALKIDILKPQCFHILLLDFTLVNPKTTFYVGHTERYIELYSKVTKHKTEFWFS